MNRQDSQNGREGMEVTDKELLNRYRDGDVSALEEVVERYRRPLFGFILSMTERREEADEIFQEVWFRVIRKFESYRDDNFMAWLFRICHNFVVDRARSAKRLVSLDQCDNEGISLVDALPAAGPVPASRVADRELGQRIRVAVRQLPPEQREVFLMRAEGELPFKEIARIQGVSINTALARMQYATAKLRMALSSEYEALRT